MLWTTTTWCLYGKIEKGQTQKLMYDVEEKREMMRMRMMNWWTMKKVLQKGKE